MATEPFSRSAHRPRPPTGRVCFGPFRFDRRSRLLFRGEEEVQLPPRALAVLERLLERAGEVVTKDDLVAAAWEDVHVGDSSLSEAVGVIRGALGDDAQDPRFVQTIHRRGYRFVAPVTLEGPAAAGTAGTPRRLDAAPAEAPAALTAAAGDRPRPSRRALVAGIAAAAVLLALLAVLAVLLRPDAPAAPTGSAATVPGAAAVRFLVHPPAGVTIPSKGGVVALSPDGRTLVFAGYDGESQRLYLRRLGSLEAEPLAGTEGGYAPFFSPDGRWLAFFDGRELKRLALAGPDGATAAGARTVADAPKAVAGAWGADGRIVFADYFRSLKAVEAAPSSGPAGSPVERLAGPDPANRERALTGVELLPGGRWALVAAWRSTVEASSIDLLDLETGERRELLAGAIAPRVVPAADGGAHLLHVTPDGLLAARLDLDPPLPAGAAEDEPPPPAVLGPATLVAAEVGVDQRIGVARYAVSAGGELVFAPAPSVPAKRRLHILRAGGREPAEEELGTEPLYYRNLAVSPDGSRFAVTVFDPPRSDVWVGEVESGALRRLTYEAFDIEPVWSPDGLRVAFGSDREGTPAIYTAPVEGDGGVELLAAGERARFPMAWSPGGRADRSAAGSGGGGTLAFVEIGPETGADLWLLDVATGEAEPFLVTGADEYSPSFSPDGRWLAYTSDASGRREIYVRALDGAGPWQITTGGGYGAEWSADGGSILVYRGLEVVAVPVTGAPPLPSGPERPLLSGVDAVRIRSLGGDAFLAVRPAAAEQPARPLHVVLDWPALLGAD